MTNGSVQLICASVLLAATVVIVWLNAAPLPALFGAVTAGVVFYLRRS